MVQNDLGDALRLLGQRGDENALIEAVTAYRAAAEERSRERVPSLWVPIQYNIAITLQMIASNDPPKLREALTAARASLDGYLELGSTIDVTRARNLIARLEAQK